MEVPQARPLLCVLALVIAAVSMSPDPMRAADGQALSRPELAAGQIQLLDADEPEAQAHHCSWSLIASSEYSIPGWYPAAESVFVYSVAFGAAYLWGRLNRIAPPWYVRYGAGALWAAIEASWLSNKFIPGDVVVQRTYEDCHRFYFYYYHYRNGAIYRSAARDIAKGSCKASNDFARKVITGQISVNPGSRYYIQCPYSGR